MIVRPIHTEADRNAAIAGIERLVVNGDPTMFGWVSGAPLEGAPGWFRRTASAALLAAALAWGTMAPANASVGFEQLSVSDGDDPAIEVGLWYPSDGPAAPHRLGPDQQTVAAGGPLVGSALPMVLMSHGTGGWFASHDDTARALAEAGFVAVAVTHTGDSFRDQSRVLRIAGRPRHVARVLDYMLAEWPEHARLDAGRVGVFGFSAGGFTALALVGGTPDFSRIAPHCSEHPKEWTCKLLREHAADGPPPAEPALHEPRLRAAVIAAPALGYIFGRDGLAFVHVPVQLWRGESDDILPQPFYAQAVADALPTPPEYHVVPNAGHFSFMAPCGPGLAAIAPDICRDAPGFDRAAFHASFNAEVVRFFARTLVSK
jgi:predicted dienelactone hydrolase